MVKQVIQHMYYSMFVLILYTTYMYYTVNKHFTDNNNWSRMITIWYYWTHEKHINNWYINRLI